MKTISTFFVIGAVAALALTGCGEDAGGVYCCTYESRHTACGGGSWTEWESEFDEFDIDNFKDGWTPERVCDKYTGIWDECGGSCCISGEYRNNVLTKGPCS